MRLGHPCTSILSFNLMLCDLRGRMWAASSAHSTLCSSAFVSTAAEHLLPPGCSISKYTITIQGSHRAWAFSAATTPTSPNVLGKGMIQKCPSSFTRWAHSTAAAASRLHHSHRSPQLVPSCSKLAVASYQVACQNASGSTFRSAVFSLLDSQHSRRCTPPESQPQHVRCWMPAADWCWGDSRWPARIQLAVHFTPPSSPF